MKLISFISIIASEIWNWLKNESTEKRQLTDLEREKINTFWDMFPF